MPHCIQSYKQHRDTLMLAHAETVKQSLIPLNNA